MVLTSRPSVRAQSAKKKSRKTRSSGSVEDRIKRIIVNELGVDESAVLPSARLVEDLGADSLDEVELVMAIEESFKFEITDDDCKKIFTVKDLTDYVRRRVKTQKPPNAPARKPK